MPIYVYRCADCSEETERRQGFSDAPLTTCETCGGSLRRVLHPVGVIFKGSGFYSTDYRNGTNGKTADSANGNGQGKTESSASNGKATEGTASKTESSDKATTTTPAATSAKSE